MGLFDDVRKALVELVTALPRINHENRQEIREVVLKLKAQLERSLWLAIVYLDGVAGIEDKRELVEYLHSAPVKLRTACNEFKVCAGIYTLADRFRQIFSPVKGTIAVGQISSVEMLIRDLARGEGTVIERLHNVTLILDDAATKLERLQGPAYEAEKKSLYAKVSKERKKLRAQIPWLTKTAKEVLSKL